MSPSMRMGECPDQCSGKAAHRQLAIPKTLLEKFPPSAQAYIKQLGGPLRCTYCGCVHAQGRKVGIWDNGILGPGWHSRQFPAL